MDLQLYKDLMTSALILMLAGYPIVSYIQMRIEKYKEKKNKKKIS